MHARCRISPVALAASLLALGAGGSAAQSACTLEYRRADTMWADWGRPDGLLGAETITLQPGQKKVFVTDWAYEKQRNDGSNFYGSHLRLAVNRGAGPVQVGLRGPSHFLIRAGSPLAANTGNIIQRLVGGLMMKMKGIVASVTGGGIVASATGGSIGASLSKGAVPGLLLPGDTAAYRHDLAEVFCPEAQAATAPPPAPPPAPVLLAVTGTAATPMTTTITVTVQAQDTQSGAALSGQVTVNGVAGATGQPITYTRCTETVEFEDTRGVTRTRTVRVPCEGTVKISGYADSYFTF